MTSLVSIVTRTKDRPVFLRRALASIDAQTLRDWELVIVNDGGAPDAIDALLSELSPATRSRIRVVTHDEPRGRWQAANAGIKASSGDLLILHDDDDSWAATFLERASTYLAANPDRVGVVSRIEIIWEERCGDTIVEKSRERFLPESVAPLLMDQQRFNQFVPISFLYRRSLHDVLGLYAESLPVVGDWVFNTRVLELGPLEYLDPAPLVYWHQRPGASGSDGNSVISARAEHARVDALLRDQQFRDYIAQHGPGGALYFERRLRQTEELVKREMQALRHDSMHPLRSVYRRAHSLFSRRVK